MNKKYLLLLIFSLLGLSMFPQQGPAVPYVTAVSGIPICNPGECTELSTLYFDTGGTTSYDVIQIPYNPPASFSNSISGSVPLQANQDDYWSNIINLTQPGTPTFKFCFFGNVYENLLLSTNGVVTFSIAQGVTPGGLYSPATPSTWVMNGTQIPVNPGGQNAPFLNSIFGVFQDTNPLATGTPNDMAMNYRISGTAPNRMFILNLYNLNQFSCNNNLPPQISQMVLYETTNVIEVYIGQRTPCMQWNGGYGVVGVQNSTGTVAYFPPTRNVGTWSASNEGWRFKPSGPSVVTIDWFEGPTASGTAIGTGPTINVCPDNLTTYTARASYLMCDGTNVVVTDQIDVNIGEDLPLNVQDITLCGEAPFTINLNDVNDNVLNGLDPNLYELSVFESQFLQEEGYGAYTTAQLQNFQVNAGEEKTIYGRIQNFDTDCLTFFQYVVKAGAQPEVTQPADMQVCDSGNDSVEIFDLTSNDAQILDGQDPTDFNVTYHTTSAGADIEDSSIADPTAFSSGDTTIYARVTNVDNADCFNVTSFDLIVTPIPQVVVPADGFACSDIGYILPNLSVGNYYTQSGGLGTQLAQASTLTDSQTVYVYAESATTPNNCFTEGSFYVTIYPTPVVEDRADLQACDAYELPALTTGNYYTGAGGTGTQLNAGDFITTSQTIYIYAVTGDATTVCSDESDFVVTINSAPTVSPATPLEECADNFDGYAYFDLTPAGVEILNGQSGLTITYHST
ncbi:hypothetical protein DEU42_115101, partial [Flavobacterium sp. AG291]